MQRIPEKKKKTPNPLKLGVPRTLDYQDKWELWKERRYWRLSGSSYTLQYTAEPC